LLAFFGGHMHKSRGFTLIELMVTIAVMAVIAMMAAPSFGNLLEKQRLNTTAKDLAYVFGQARSQSAVLRQNTTVNFGDNPYPENPFFNAVNYYWKSKYSDITMTSDTTAVVFLPIGLVTTRENEVNNPNYDPTKPKDPVTNPEKIKKAVPLVFTVCSAKLKASKEISISKTGIIEKIQDKTGACS